MNFTRNDLKHKFQCFICPFIIEEVCITTSFFPDGRRGPLYEVPTIQNIINTDLKTEKVHTLFTLFEFVQNEYKIKCQEVVLNKSGMFKQY